MYKENIESQKAHIHVILDIHWRVEGRGKWCGLICLS